VKPDDVQPLFALGQVVATPGALDLLDRTAIDAMTLIDRHQRGDWGMLSPEDIYANAVAVEIGTRILSSYELGNANEKLWVLTEADRSSTTLLLPEEY
jgi:hypothetical protein